MAFVAVLVAAGCTSSGDSAAEENRCPSLSGSAQLDFSTDAGIADITWNGEEYSVHFEGTSVAETHTGFTIGFDWHFPEGTISIIEYSEAAPAGDAYPFESEVFVTRGGEGRWVWSGVVDTGAGVADIQTIEGDLCIDG